MEDEILTVAPLERGKDLGISPQQNITSDIKSWLKITGLTFPYGLTETRDEFYARTGISPQIRIEFSHIANDEVCKGLIKKGDISRITSPTAEEITRVMAKAEGHIEDQRVGSYLFTKKGIFALTETPAAFAQRAGIALVP